MSCSIAVCFFHQLACVALIFWNIWWLLPNLLCLPFSHLCFLLYISMCSEVFFLHLLFSSFTYQKNLLSYCRIEKRQSSYILKWKVYLNQFKSVLLIRSSFIYYFCSIIMLLFLCNQDEIFSSLCLDLNRDKFYPFLFSGFLLLSLNQAAILQLLRRHRRINVNQGTLGHEEV